MFARKLVKSGGSFQCAQVPITDYAVEQRINGRLRKSQQRLCKSYKSKRAELGRYYVKDARGKVIRTHVNLETIARELCVL